MKKPTGILQIRNLVVAALALAFALPTVGHADLIDDHVNAIGGEEVIAKLKTFKRTGTIRLGGFVDFSGTYEQSALVGAKAYTKTVLTNISVEEQGWNGTVGWKRDSQAGLNRVYGTDLSQIRSIAEVNGIVEIYRQHGRTAFTRGQDQSFGEKKCHVLDVVGVPLRFFIDPQTKMLAGSRLTLGPDVAIVSAFSDYAEFGGVKMPKHLNIDISNGAITIDITFDKTETGVTLPDSLFEMPAE